MKWLIGLVILCTVLQGRVENTPQGCVGIILKPDLVTVKKVIKGSPADLVGIVPKDKIGAILTEDCEPSKLEGPIGEKVVIKVLRRECIYTYKPWKSCPYCSGEHDTDVIKTFIVQRVECNHAD